MHHVESTRLHVAGRDLPQLLIDSSGHATMVKVVMRLILVFVLTIAGCHYDGKPIHPKPGELPPLPPASGTPVGYLIDSAVDLQLRPDQVQQLKQIDQSLATNNADIDAQLRQIERPQDEQQPSPQDQRAGKKGPRHNHAPGAAITTTADAGKLHDMRARNDRDALTKAWAVLDPGQQTAATQVLEVRGVEVPGAAKKQAAAPTDDSKPVPGLEP